VTNTEVFDVLSADLNGDGKPDLIAVYQNPNGPPGTGGVAVFLANGYGFSEPIMTGVSGASTLGPAYAAAAGDFKWRWQTGLGGECKWHCHSPRQRGRDFSFS
jgi:hypothetical protein